MFSFYCHEVIFVLLLFWLFFVFSSLSFVFRKFIDLFMTECTRRGIQIAAPADIRFNVADPERLKNEMLIAAEHQCEYVFVAHPDNADEMHGLLN